MRAGKEKPGPGKGKGQEKHGSNSPGIAAGLQDIRYNSDRGSRDHKAWLIRIATGKRAGKSGAPG
jgi:hypothetical protein